eukprot:CAMPEP_0172576824 /NCGR_PEP_ID=MMETSP1067-20121228/137919_1 /TAXON_ID=265564 ORGANISM="Thalassiosira punctigera, Strain Tpunct2005C2" /NCGR_SAMPLE_ID=MMETSP1067 /ASSEMBLY_ACC=CAM_ASM_000444 /LENGTH=1016 /DNA_ID=CAMNT_0013369499 /DNA_START=288 /DNA_END=3335 /DNA_ORIENTATION=-
MISSSSSSSGDDDSFFIPSNPCSARILNLFNDEEMADTVFECRQEKFHAHRLILRACAPGLAEHVMVSNATALVPVDGVEPLIFRYLLRYVYGGSVPRAVLRRHSREIIDAAHQFGLGSLKVHAESAGTITLDNFLEHLRFAESRNLALLNEKVADFLVENREDVRKMLLSTSTLLTDNISSIASKSSSKSPNIDTLRRKLDQKGLGVDGTREMLISALENNCAPRDDDTPPEVTTSDGEEVSVSCSSEDNAPIMGAVASSQRPLQRRVNHHSQVWPEEEEFQPAKITMPPTRRTASCASENKSRLNHPRSSNLCMSVPVNANTTRCISLDENGNNNNGSIDGEFRPTKITTPRTRRTPSSANANQSRPIHPHSSNLSKSVPVNTNPPRCNFQVQTEHELDENGNNTNGSLEEEFRPTKITMPPTRHAPLPANKRKSEPVHPHSSNLSMSVPVNANPPWCSDGTIKSGPDGIPTKSLARDPTGPDLHRSAFDLRWNGNEYDRASSLRKSVPANAAQSPSQFSKSNVPSLATTYEDGNPSIIDDDNDPNGRRLGSMRRHLRKLDDVNSSIKQAFDPKALDKAKDMTCPQGEVTIVFTDVQGSTSLWESCPNDMKKAQDIHDAIMRRCYTNHSGYEITTEGDAFQLAFKHPLDAFAFALQAQLRFYDADWPEGILKHPDGEDVQALKFKGLRVRFGIHHGSTNSRVHESTGKTVYTGEGVEIAKKLEGMCHGGQILTSMETWKAVSGMAERCLGRPQVLDCGVHLLSEKKIPIRGHSGYKTVQHTRRIMQLVPSGLEFDFSKARGRREFTSEVDGKVGFEIKDSSSVNGRLFPPVISKRQLTTCFLNAPYANGRVTICFVYTVGLGAKCYNRAESLRVLAKHIRKQLLGINPPGYECQEDNGCWMLAFDRMAHAVTFGLSLKDSLERAGSLLGNVDLENMFKVGIVSGSFTSMEPHKTTGMADYFGPIVNRAARVASNCSPGQVCIGIPLSGGLSADPPDFGSTVNVLFEGTKKLKGI